MALIEESNGPQALNSVIILIKLNLNDVLASLWSNKATNHPQPTQLSAKLNEPSANTRMFESIEIALHYLSKNVNVNQSKEVIAKTASMEANRA